MAVSAMKRGASDILILGEFEHGQLIKLVEHHLQLPEEPDHSLESIRTEHDQRQKRLLMQALIKTGGNLSRAAKLLGLSRGGLRGRAHKHGLL